jgi:hypothetical protein
MARIRSIKPEFWDDRKLAKRTSRDARLLYIALWNLADEWGRVNGDPQWIKGQVFSYDDDLTADSIAKMLEELENPALGAVVAYEADGDPYLFLPKLGKHQRLEPEKVKSRLPEPPDPDDSGPNPPSSESRADLSERDADEFARDADESEADADKPALLYVAGSMEHDVPRTAAQDAPPRRKRATRLPDDFAVTPDMVTWAKRECPQVDGKRETEKFANYWRAKSGKDATKHDWPATWRNWMLNAAERTPQGRASPGGRQNIPVAPGDEWKFNRS